MEKKRLCCLIIILVSLQFLLSWVSATSRGNNNGVSSIHKSGSIGSQVPSKLKSKEEMKSKGEIYKEVETGKWVKKVGSSPPSCEHKCYGCIPCEPAQVPTTITHFRVQYTNYEPEGWKCKCGPSFYSP